MRMAEITQSSAEALIEGRDVVEKALRAGAARMTSGAGLSLAGVPPNQEDLGLS